MTQSPIVLALDVAKNRTGWAIGSPAWPRPFWGVFELSGQYEGNEGRHLHRWRQFLIDKIENQHITYVAIEAAFIDTKDFDWRGSEPQIKMHGIAEQLLVERGIQGGRASIAAWRKRFLGTCKTPAGITRKRDRTEFWKKAALHQCVARGWYVTHHDEAEALGIMDFTLAALSPEYEHRTGPKFRRAEYAADFKRGIHET